MDTTGSLLSQLDAYRKELSISRRDLANRLEIPHNTLRAWFKQGKSRKNPSEANLTKIRTFLESRERPEIYRQVEEGKRRAEKAKYLLLLLEDELRWFRDGTTNAREIFRKELDANDIGYISSLLTMLGDEDKFKRWLTLTTTQFQSFKGR
jgi:transcriptional regulator with XRE-family HTH domain